MYNLDPDLEDLEAEVAEVMEHFTVQCKKSGWERAETREMVLSGYTGWERRIRRRRQECGGNYRSAVSSLPTRARKKLTGKEDWYRTRKDSDKEDDDHRRDRRVGKKRKRGENVKQDQPSNNIAVMFVPFTPGGELARRLRESEAQLEKQTGYRIKIVERTGTKIEDLLHRSNPWQGQDCEREGCLLCKTKIRTAKNTD